MSRDNDVTVVLALNRISALFGIFFFFFFNALRYVFFGSSASVKCVRAFGSGLKLNLIQSVS